MCATQCLVARSRNNFSQWVLCSKYHSLYFDDGVYWRKHRWGPSSGNLETKNASFFRSCFLQICFFMCAAQYLSRYKLPLCILRDGFVCTYFLALYWLMVFIYETHVMPSSGKVKTKRHLFSYLVIAGSECCPMRQLLQTQTNYHITYFWLVQVAPILWHYIDWWCLFMKHMWCHLVAK